MGTVRRNVLEEIKLVVVTKQECSESIREQVKLSGVDFGLKHFLNPDDGSVIGYFEALKLAVLYRGYIPPDSTPKKRIETP